MYSRGMAQVILILNHTILVHQECVFEGMKVDEL